MSTRVSYANWRSLGIKDDKPELLVAQAKALARQIPLLYFILAVNSLLLSHASINKAPIFLTVVVPTCLCVACAVRGLVWHKNRFQSPGSAAQIASYLRRTTMLAVIIGILFVAWAISIFAYADDVLQLHLAFFVAATAFGCALCLMYLPFAAILLTFIVLVPLTIVFVATGHPTLISISINTAIIDVTFAVVLVKYFKHFETAVEARVDLRNQNAEISRLHDRTKALDAQRRHERAADMDNIAAAFTLSIEGVTRVLGDVASHNALQSRDVASASDAAVGRLEQATDAANGAEHALKSVADATTALFEAINAIKTRTWQSSAMSTTLEARAGSADGAMQTLDATVKQIDNIANLIKSIANQIDLIALNATIEAARAGDAGRGFAVVAAEIKVLASRTAHAIDDVARHVGNVKTASRDAHSSVVAMKDAFFELRAVGDDIAGALEIQTAVTDDIRGFVGIAVEGAAIMRRNLADMTDSAKSTHTSAHGMLDQCEVLRAETDVLAREVGNFIVFIKAA